MRTLSQDKLTKVEFIRARPNLNAQEISKEAESFNLEISPQTVWSVRSKLRAEAQSNQTTSVAGTTEAPVAKKVAKKASKKAAKKVAPVEAAAPVAKKAAKKPHAPDPNFNKSEFIRKHPNQTAAQVVAAAAALSQVISEGMVYSVRSSDKSKANKKAAGKAKPAVAKVAAAPVAKKASKKAAKKHLSPDPNFNKSEFIRKHPHQKAGEVVAAAAALGQVITDGLVYSVRNADKKKNGGAPKSKKAAPAMTRPKSPMKVIRAAKATNGHKVAFLVFDPHDPQSVKEAKKTFSEVVAQA